MGVRVPLFSFFFPEELSFCEHGRGLKTQIVDVAQEQIKNLMSKTVHIRLMSQRSFYVLEVFEGREKQRIIFPRSVKQPYISSLSPVLYREMAIAGN